MKEEIEAIIIELLKNSDRALTHKEMRQKLVEKISDRMEVVIHELFIENRIRKTTIGEVVERFHLPRLPYRAGPHTRLYFLEKLEEKQLRGWVKEHYNPQIFALLKWYRNKGWS